MCKPSSKWPVATFMSMMLMAYPALIQIPKGWASEDNAEARRLAAEAFEQIQENPYDAEGVEAATEKLARAAAINPDEPQIYASSTVLTLILGYVRGDLYNVKSFAPGTVDRAMEMAKKAIELDPNYAPAQAQLARMLIMTRQLDAAQQHVQRVQELDPNEFYGWYYAGVIEELRGNFPQALKWFDDALPRAVHNWQHNSLLSRRLSVANYSRNPQEMERCYNLIIERNPSSPHAHGNYAQFLLEMGRYEQAVTQFEKAVELGPYPMAVEGLKEARQLRETQQSKN